MAIAIYQDQDGLHHWADSTSTQTQRRLAMGDWVLFDDTPATPPPPGEPFDNAVAALFAPASTSASAERLRAAFVSGNVLDADGVAMTTKKLNVVLDANGEIDDLIIEDVA